MMDSSLEPRKNFPQELKKLILKASSWTVLGHAWNQGLRFIGNLILARLLIPEDFGLMQLVFVFMQGVSMFSDLGISTNIIQHAKGDDPQFLKIAWTIQILRGILIEGILILLAYPLAKLYGAPDLVWLIPLGGINAVIDSMASTNLLTCNRKMDLKKLTLLDMGCQFVGICVMIICAWHWRSVWTLLMSSFVSGTLKTLLSHVIFTGPKMGVSWHKEYFDEIISFGKWIFISSMAGFIFSRADRIVLGLYLTISALGLYGIAYAIAMAFIDLLQTMADKVLLPLYAHLWKNSLDKMRHQIFKVRIALMFCSLPPLFCLVIWGQPIIHFLYPANYRGAGWMLQILAVACCFRCISATISPILFAVGNSFRAMVVILSAAILMIGAIVFQGHFFGAKGVLWAIPTAELLNYPVLVACVRKYGVWLPYLDFAGFAMTILVCFLTGLLS
jgi:O-antigen/teichoic acid export membrane protein